MSAQLWSGELSIEVVGDLLWGGYLWAVKCDCLVLSLGRRSTIYFLDSSPQFCRICLVIQRLHELSPLLSFMFVRCSGDLIVHLWQGGRGWISWSGIISCSLLFQYLCWNRLCVDSVSSRGYVVWCCVKNNGTQDLFSFLGSQLEAVFCSACLQSLYCIGPSLPFSGWC